MRGGVTSQSTAVASSDAVPVAPAAGDLVFVVLVAGNAGGGATIPPTVTPGAGWEILDNQTFNFYGIYPSRHILMRKVINSSEASNLGATYTVDSANIIATDAWGIRGADPASMVIGSTLNTTDTNLMWPSISTLNEALIIRLATNHDPNAGFWAMSGPSGHTRLNNKKSVDPNTGLYYTTSSGSSTGTAGPVQLANGGNIVPTFSYTISLADVSGPPALELSLDKYTVPVNAPIGYVAANILGQTVGSTLSDNADGAVTDAKLTRVGTEFRVAAPLTLGEGLQVAVTETLEGASNSPYGFSSIIDVVGPSYSEYVASASGTNTLAPPTHQPGDLLVGFLFRDGSTTAPVTPTGWTSAATGTSTSCSYRLVWKVAITNAESAGGTTTATSTITSCYRPGAGYALSLGATAQGNGSSTSLTYQSLSMQVTDGTSRVAAFAGHRSVNTALETPPTGMVLRHSVVDATDEAAAFDTNGYVTSWTAKTVGVGGTSSGWITTTFEIRSQLISLPTNDRQPRTSVWL